MAEIINCPDCMGKGCPGCNDTREMLCFGLDDMQRAANVLATIREAQTANLGQAPRWWILPVQRGDSERMQAQARLIAEHPHLCMVDAGGAGSIAGDPGLPGSTNVVAVAVGPDWSGIKEAPDA